MLKALAMLDRIHSNSQHRIKDVEKAKVYQKVCLNPGITRKLIISQLEMRPTTVSNLTAELIEQDLISEGMTQKVGKKGRPEVSLDANYDKFVCIAVYVVSTQLKAVLLNLKGDVLTENSIHADPDIQNEELMEILIALVDPMKKMKPKESELLGICISFPGFFNRIQQELMFSIRWHNVRRFSFAGLSQRCGSKVVVNTSLEAQLSHLLTLDDNYRKGGTMLYHWGYGIGASYANDGQIIRSTPGYIMEAGHIPINPHSMKACKCGKNGCLEADSSIWALLPQLQQDGITVPEDEIAFRNFLMENDISKNHVIRHATENVAYSLNMIFRLLFPDRIVILGPFIADRTIFSLLETQFHELLPEHALGTVDLIPLQPDFRGEIYGSTYELFLSHLREKLIAIY